MAAAPMLVAVHSAHRLVGEALSWCLANQPGLIVVGHTQQWAQLAGLCRLRQPEVVVVDVPHEIDETVRRLCWIAASCGIAYVVLLSDVAPCRALLSRDVIWRLCPQSRGLGPLLSLLGDREVVRPATRAARLTEREVQVLTMVGNGLTAPEIACRLAIGLRSVENHKRRIYAKLGAQSQAGAVGAVARLGVFDTGPRPAGVNKLKLSSRESEILALSARGLSVRQIAASLGVAPKTVESQLCMLYRKLGVHSRAAALATVRARGLLTDIP